MGEKLSPMNVKLCEDIYDHMALLWSKKQKSQIKKKTRKYLLRERWIRYTCPEFSAAAEKHKAKL